MSAGRSGRVSLDSLCPGPILGRNAAGGFSGGDPEVLMDLTDKDVLELAQYAFVRLDGAWFLTLARKLGVETAFEMDIETWKHFSYVFAKKLRKEHIPEPVWPESFITALSLMGALVGVKGREVFTEGRSVTVRVTDCETQKAIAKAGIADCGIATVQSYQGLVRGLFGKESEAQVRHTRNLNHGDPYCEVVITLPAG